MKIRILSIFLLATIFYSCGKSSWYSGGKNLIGKHQSMAIIPPSLFIENCSDLSSDSCLAVNKLESKYLYMDLFSKIAIKNAEKNNLLELVRMSDIEQVMNEDSYNLNKKDDRNRLSDALGADVLLLSEFQLSKPNSIVSSVATAVAKTVLLKGIGLGSNTNLIEGYVTLYDVTTEKDIWTFEHAIGGGFLEKMEGITDELLYRIVRKLPYY